MKDTSSAPWRCRCLPQSLLEPVSGLDGYLQLRGSTVEWFIYFRQGKIVYATNSVDPLERLDRYLLGLGHELPRPIPEIKVLVRSYFEDATAPKSHLTSDYRAIVELVRQGILDRLMASTLASKMTAEVFESYLLLPEAEYGIHHVIMANLPKVCSLEPKHFVERTQTRLKLWRTLLPRISSPYQRPYLAGEAIAYQKLSPKSVSALSRFLMGSNFRQLGLRLNQDELVLAKRLLPLINNGVVILRDPVAPFDQLPRFTVLTKPSTGAIAPKPETTPETLSEATPEATPEPALAEPVPPEPALPEPAPQAAPDLAPGVAVPEDLPEIAEVTGGLIKRPTTSLAPRPVPVTGHELGDRATLADEIQKHLEDQAFSLALMDEPDETLLRLSSMNPDFILLDATTPEVDGYRVCSLIRKSPMLKHVPIVMVMEQEGLMERAKAKLAGATAHLPKSFSQEELAQLLSRHHGKTKKDVLICLLR